MLAPIITEPPAYEMDKLPVTIEEAKLHMRNLSDAENPTIYTMIKAATMHLDGINGVLGVALLQQTWKLVAPDWPCGSLRLPIAPVRTIDSIKYFDSSNSEQTIDPLSYDLFEDVIGPIVVFKPTAILPAAYVRPDAIQVTFAAGYENRAAIPTPIKQHILELVANMFENREKTVVGQSINVISLPNADMLIASYRRRAF